MRVRSGFIGVKTICRAFVAFMKAVLAAVTCVKALMAAVLKPAKAASLMLALLGL
jgi:hypothetical protein